MKRSQEKQKEFKGINTEPLINYNIGKIHASVILDIRKRKNDGQYPVKVRVSDELRKQYYWDCMSVTALEYHKLHSKRPDAYTKKTLKVVTDFWEDFKVSLTDLVNKEGFSKKRLDQRLAKGAKDSVIEAFDAKIAALKHEGRIGSMVWYTGAKSSIKKFIGEEDLKFSEVTSEWLKDYQRFLLTEKRNAEGKLIVKAKKKTTISIIMRALRAIINGAKEEGVITKEQYPFGKKKYEIPEAEGRIIALSEDQIKAISQYPKLNPDAFIYRRLWLFSYFCNGINVGDMLRLRYRSIIKDDGKYFIEWKRKKTEHQKKEITIKALIRPEMQKIIDMHGNKDKRPDNFIFPYLRHGLSPLEERMIIQNTIHTINKKMTAIGQDLQYGDITTYWARHAFTNNSLNKKVSIFSLQDRLGHTTSKVTQNYAGRLSNKQIIEDANVLDTVEI